MKRLYIFIVIAFAAASAAFAKSAPTDTTATQTANDQSTYLKHNVTANQEYRMFVYDTTGSPIDLSEGRSLSASRGFWKSLWQSTKAAYSSTAIGTLTDISSTLLTSGVGWIVEVARSKKSDWLQQVRKDCVFTKQLPMQQSIIDFYADNSTKGALDPDGVQFDGFGCQQYLTYVDTINVGGKIVNNTVRLPVFDLKCSLRVDSIGKARMLHHGKFEIVVDRLIFNPYLCNLPNDSVMEDNINDCRTPFDFERRKDLTFQINATITSSWMNEAIQIVEDQKLGEFVIKAVIPDASYLETDGAYPGYFVYVNPDNKSEILSHDLTQKIAKQVSVSGDCFLVPRSYIGCDNENGDNRTWGTGQYKVNMTLTESCDVNMDFYYDDKDKGGNPQAGNPQAGMPTAGGAPGGMAMNNQKHHWNYHWSEEWKRIKRRKKTSGNIFATIYDNLKMQYADRKWINVIVDPVITTTLSKENEYLQENFAKWLKLGEQTSAASTSSSAGSSAAAADTSGMPMPQ